MQSNVEYGARSFVFGVATPLDSVTVALVVQGSKEVQTNTTVFAGTDGHWSISVNPLKPSEGDLLDLSVITGSGDTHVALGCGVGDVYLCGGQSNMCFSAEESFPPGPDLANQTYDGISLFAVNMIGAATPGTDFPPINSTTPQCSWAHDLNHDPEYVCNAWMPSTPRTNAHFSAVCLFTALEMRKQQAATGAAAARKIGLIFSAFGGTSLSLWAPPTAYDGCPGAAAPNPPPGSLYNAMIAPIAGYTVRSALWFQGEEDAQANSVTPGWYACRFERLIAHWRAVWGIGDFTFAFVQLGSVSADSDAFGGVRIAQALALPHPGGPVDATAMAVAYDLGDRNQVHGIGSVHFRNKTEVARRLAAGILHASFGDQNSSLLGPSLLTAKQSSSRVVVLNVISSADGGFISLAPAGECVECCTSMQVVQLSASGVGGPWVNASLTLVNSSVFTATASDPATFTHVRYAMTSMVECAITDEANGFPLPAFLVALTAEKALTTIPQTLNWRGRLYPLDASAPLPPLGFNTWNAYHDNVDEVLVLAIADAFVSLGLKAVGYKFVNIDDGWMVARTENGTIVADPVKFPSGMAALSAGVHSRGMRFGLYTSQTASTCQDRPGTYLHEAQDVATWCAWAIDYIKIDYCHGAQWPNVNESWILINEAVATLCVNNPLVISVEYCDGPSCGPMMSGLATLWRTTMDIQATFASILSNLETNNKMAPFHTPGHFNDPDMLCAGVSGVSLVEAQTQFSAWAVIAAPMLLSFDILNPAGVDPALLTIISNVEVIAVSQDAAQVQGVLVSPPDPGGGECWARPLAGVGEWGKADAGAGAGATSAAHAVAALFINRGDIDGPKITVSCTWAQLGVPAGSTVTVRDLIAHTNLANVTIGDAISFDVLPHQGRFVKLQWI